MLEAAAPDDTQATDIDFLLSLGELFALVVYAQLILENVELMSVSEPVTEQIFDVLVRDFLAGATRLHGKSTTNDKQAAFALQMVQRPDVDPLLVRVCPGIVHGACGRPLPLVCAFADQPCDCRTEFRRGHGRQKPAEGR